MFCAMCLRLGRKFPHLRTSRGFQASIQNGTTTVFGKVIADFATRYYLLDGNGSDGSLLHYAKSQLLDNTTFKVFLVLVPKSYCFQ